MARVAPEVGFGSSTGRGHDDRARVQVSRRIPHVCAKALSCLLLIAVTAGRITGNVVNVLNSASPELYGDMPIPVQVFDCFFRPLLGGLSFMPFLLRRPKLYFCSFFGCFITMITTFWLERTGPHLLPLFLPRDGRFIFQMMINLCWYMRSPLAGVTLLKLRALGWPRTGFFCFWGFNGWLFVRLYVIIVAAGGDRTGYFFAFVHVGQGFISAVNGFVLLYESRMKQRLLNKMIDKKLAQSASRGVWFLRLGAFLTLLDAVYLPLVETYSYSDSEHEIHLSPALFLTFDNSVVLASILILGGLIGPRDRLDPIEVMAELEHIARTQGKRIAFPGKLNRHSKHCIVSFPGKYSSET